MKERIVLNRPIPAVSAKEILNVKHYGAKGDGVTDDRAAIKSALDAAIANLPAVVYFPPGDYGISGGIEIKPAQGSRGLTIKGAGASATRIRFNKGSALVDGQYIAFAIAPVGTVSVGDYPNYLHDVIVQDIGFYDDEPAIHGGGTANDESHAIKIQYAVNATIDSCKADSIGDEGFDLNYCSQSRITNNTTINTPSLGSASALNCQFSNSILISGNTCHGSSTPGTISTVTGSGGIGIEIVASIIVNVDNIIVTNNVIRDFEADGIFPNNAVNTAEMKNVNIENNIIDNCGVGIAMRGSNLHQFFNIIGNIITNADIGIEFDLPLIDNVDCVISFNTIDTTTGRGILCNGTRLNLSGNNLSNTASQAIFMNVALDVVISGGIIDSCGGVGIPCIAANADGKEVTIDGVQILNASSTTQVILSCERIKNCRIHQTTPNAGQVWSANEVTNNTMNGGIDLDGTNYGSGVITGNKINVSSVINTGTHTGGNGEVTIMTDSTGGYGTNILIGDYIHNITDGSSGAITANTSTTITVSALSGGTDNDWDTNDAYVVSKLAALIDLSGVAINITAANNASIISNNYVCTIHGGTNRVGINVASGSDNNVVIGNVTVADTAASGIVDAGTGTAIANNIEI